MMKTSVCRFLLFAVFTHFFTAHEAEAQKRVGPESISQPSGTPSAQVFNVNRISSWFRSNGNGNFPPSGTGDGVMFPRKTGSVIYEDGIMWGGKVWRDVARTIPGPLGQPYRVGGNEYLQGNQAGPVVGLGSSAVAANPSDPAVRIYRIRRDWNALTYDELQNDAADFYETFPTYTSWAQIEAVKSQYAKDWTEWPVVYGAPYIDRNGSPGYQRPPAFNYDPTVGPLFTAESLITQKYDEPGICGADPNMPADQVLWTVYNDLNRTLTTALYGSEPLGLEIQVTLWGYKRNDPLGNVVFKRARIINKGGIDTSGAGKKGTFWIDSMYVAQWSDPDVGNGFDDIIGCDTLMSLGFAYNSNTSDAEYNVYSLPPPAVGYDFFAGPAVPASQSDSAIFNLRYVHGKKNLGLTSFAYFSPASIFSDPRPRDWTTGTTRWYKMLRGYAPVDGPETYYPFPPGVTPDKFPLSGDPVAGTGFIDGLGTNYSLVAGDRRIILSSGPFALAPGDTQEIVVALMAGIGADRLTSIVELKAIDAYTQAMFGSLFALPEAPTFSVEVTYPLDSLAEVKIKASDLKKTAKTVNTVLKNLDGSDFASLPLYDDGAHNDASADDGVFGGSIIIARQRKALYLNSTVVFKNGLSAPLPRVADNITTAGAVRVTNPVVFFDNVNNDGVASPNEFIHFGFTVENATAFIFPKVRLKAMAATYTIAGIDIPQIQPTSQYSLAYDSSNTNTYVPLQIPAQYSNSTTRIPFIITDSLSNKWVDTLAIPIVRITTTKNYWQSTSGPFGGNIKSITKSSAGILYAVNYPAGVYRSTDDGENWSKIAGTDMAYPYGVVTAVDQSVVVASYLGVFRSTDAGTTWNRGYDLGSTSGGIAVSPSGHIYLSDFYRLLRSTNNGTTWEVRSDNIDPTNYPAIQCISFNSTGHVFLGTSIGLYRSTDEGLTWGNVGLASKLVLSIQIHPNGTILAGTDSTLHRSADGGVTWVSFNLGASAARVPSLMIGSNGIVYAGNSNGTVFISNDAGLSWSPLAANIQGAVQVLARDGSGRLLVGTTQSLFRWSVSEQKWEEKVSGLSGLACYSFAPTPWSEVYASTSRGLFRSSDYGSSWSLVYPFAPPAIGPLVPLSIAVKSNGVVFIGTNNGIAVSFDNGTTWTPTGLAGSTVQSLTITKMGHILAGTTDAGRIYRSSDEGTAWTVTRTGTYSGEVVSALAVDAEGNIYASTQYGIMASTDDGLTWNQKQNNYYTTAFHIAGDGTLYATFYGIVYQSTDRGSTWVPLFPNRGLTSYRARAVATNSLGHIFAGTLDLSLEDQGVFRSTDAGKTWFKITAGLGLTNSSMVYSLSHTGNGYLLVGTNGEGIYRTVTTTALTETPFDFTLAQNYPNPFNAITTIQYSIPYRTLIKLRIYNLLGQEIQTLVSDELGPGVYLARWNASRFASGVYFCRLQAGDLIHTTKLMLLK